MLVILIYWSIHIPVGKPYVMDSQNLAFLVYQYLGGLIMTPV